MTFSIIVPVYNVEKYLAKCLDSLLAQTDPDFEILVVNDGSPDNSQQIIDRYAAEHPQKIRAFLKENGGLSDARNYGIDRAKGEYLLFVDSDDYVAPDLLEKLREEIAACQPDVIGFHLAIVNEEGIQTGLLAKPVFSGLSGEEGIITLVDSKLEFIAACGYAYRRDYWQAQGFAFMKGIYHEDFALIPLVLLRAAAVSCIDLEGYFYVSTEGSIMRTQTPQRDRKRAEDLLKGYDFRLSAVTQTPAKDPRAQAYYLAHGANALIYRINTLEPENKAWFRKELIRRKVIHKLAGDTLKRKLRKILFRLKYRI